MSTKTTIEWTDHTFNIAWGCVKVSPGCENCYAETWAKWTWKEKVWGPAKTTPRCTFGEKHWAEPLEWNAIAEREGRRHKVFCSSMADIGEDHPTITAELLNLWPLIRATPWLDWQLLTKRPERLPEILPPDWGDGYPNVWLGTSVESQLYADIRIPQLIRVPARIRWLSIEPLLGPVRLDREIGDAPIGEMPKRTAWLRHIHWVVVGGESGAGARGFDVRWAYDLKQDCLMNSRPIFMKQLGAKAYDSLLAWKMVDRAYTPGPVQALALAGFALKDKKGGDMAEWPHQLRIREFPAVAS